MRVKLRKNKTIFLKKQIWIVVNLTTAFFLLEEEVWNNQYHLLDNKKIDVRYLFSNTVNDLRLYRMDIRTSNKDNDDNTINNVILKSNLIKIWTDLNKEIKKISITYGNSTYKIKLEDVK